MDDTFNYSFIIALLFSIIIILFIQYTPRSDALAPFSANVFKISSRYNIFSIARSRSKRST